MSSSGSDEEKQSLCSEEDKGAGKEEGSQEVTTPLARKYTLPSGRNGIRLSPVEEEMLHWAMDGFPPRGEEGLRVPLTNTGKTRRKSPIHSFGSMYVDIYWKHTADCHEHTTHAHACAHQHMRTHTLTHTHTPTHTHTHKHTS